MRITIIPSDKTIIIDGEARFNLEFDIDPLIHAVQWYDTHGEIEYINSNEYKPNNRYITELSEFDSAIKAWSDAKIENSTLITELVNEDESTAVTEITMRQARLFLYNVGLLNEVQNFIDAGSETNKIEWEYATTVERNSPLVTAIGALLGLTDEMIDQMFQDASNL